MRKPHPIFIIFTAIVSATCLSGAYLIGNGVLVNYNVTYLLLFAVASAWHFIEEHRYQVWGLPQSLELPIPDFAGEMTRQVFVSFSHLIVLTNFVVYFLIFTGNMWAGLYGLVVPTVFGIGNGIAHLAIYLKSGKNTGVLSGLCQLVSGVLIWLSYFSII